MKESVDCQINFVRRDCGERAVVFVDKYLKEMSSQLMVDHCATYTYSDSCKPRIDSLSNSSLINISLNLFLILVCLSKIVY